MNEQWALGIKSAGVILSICTALCTALALYIRLSVNSQLSDFLEKLTDKLGKTYVSKELFEESKRHDAETGLLRSAAVEAGNRHTEEKEALRLAILEAKTEVRLSALEVSKASAAAAK
jgi:hypothetical protein